MRRLLPVFLLVVLPLAAPAAAGAAVETDRERACAQRGATVARSATARLYEIDRGGDHTLYGCLRAGGRRQVLATWFSCECSVGDEPAPGVKLLAGHFAALTHHPSCGPFPCEAGPRHALRNLRTGRTVAPLGEVRQVVRGRGFFAYDDGRVVIVRGATERVVDPGPGVEAGSLAVAGQRVYWMRDGAPQSAQ